MSATAYTMWIARTYSAVIEPVECLGETDKMVTLKSGRRRVKLTVYEGFFGTWNEAHDFLVAHHQEKVESLRSQLEQANGRLGQIRGMRPPEGVE